MVLLSGGCIREMLVGQWHGRRNTSCWVLSRGSWCSLVVLNSGMPGTLSCWSLLFPPGFLGSLDICWSSRQGINFPMSHWRVLVKGCSGTQGFGCWSTFSALLCLHLQVWILAQGVQLSLQLHCTELVVQHVLGSGSWPSNAVALPVNHVGPRSTGRATHPSPVGVGRAWRKQGGGLLIPVCLTLYRKGFWKNCVWPSGDDVNPNVCFCHLLPLLSPFSWLHFWLLFWCTVSYQNRSLFR